MMILPTRISFAGFIANIGKKVGYIKIICSPLAKSAASPRMIEFLNASKISRIF
jgi:hypothetical protein